LQNAKGIFDSILAKSAEGYREQANRVGVDGEKVENDVPYYSTIELDELIQKDLLL